MGLMIPGLARSLLWPNLRRSMVSLPRGSGSVVPVNFEQVSEIVSDRQKSDENGSHPILVDVRPPAEIQAYGGPIPTAQVIPMDQLESALASNPIDFQAKYGWEKPVPGKDDLVFYCKIGGRAGMAANMALKCGYNSYCYTGSWTDWQARTQHN